VRRQRSWRLHHFVFLALLMAGAVWANWQPLTDMAALGWKHEEQSHIFLAPLIALWLLWLRRSRLRYVSLSPSLLGPAVVLAGWLVSWWGFDQGVQIAWHAGALATFLGVLLSFTGVLPLRLFASVFVVLIFMLPIPGRVRHDLSLPMQELATSVTHAMLELIGVAAFKSGNVLIINGERVAVGEACNGMRMVFALALVVYAFAFGTPLKLPTRLVLLALSPVVAMVCNVIRLVPTSLIFGYGRMETAQVFHDWAGWVMLPLALIVLVGVLKTIRWLEFPTSRYRLVSQ
jgi:exosortase